MSIPQITIPGGPKTFLVLQRTDLVTVPTTCGCSFPTYEEADAHLTELMDSGRTTGGQVVQLMSEIDRMSVQEAVERGFITPGAPIPVSPPAGVDPFIPQPPRFAGGN